MMQSGGGTAAIGEWTVCFADIGGVLSHFHACVGLTARGSGKGGPQHVHRGSCDAKRQQPQVPPRSHCAQGWHLRLPQRTSGMLHGKNRVADGDALCSAPSSLMMCSWADPCLSTISRTHEHEDAEIAADVRS